MTCRISKDYSWVISDLNDINALLPDEYHIDINTSGYNALVSRNMYALCSHCTTVYDYKDKDGNMQAETRPTEIEKSQVNIQSKLLSTKGQMLSSLSHIRVWLCPKCKAENRLESTEWIKDKLQSASYLKVIPEAPIKKDGLRSRRDYPNLIKTWIALFQEELEHQIGLYRKEYQPQTGEEGQEQGQNQDFDIE